MSMPLPRMAYGYLRVSDDKQLTKGGTIMPDGLSMDAQQEAILRYYEYHLKPKGYLWGEYFGDPGVSARSKPFRSRPAGKALNVRLNRGDIVIFSKLDRGFRKIRDFIFTTDAWKVRGIDYVFINLGIDTTSETIGSKIALHVIALLAEIESDIKSERITEVIHNGRAKGMVNEPYPPHGFKVGHGRKAVPNWEEREAMQVILAMRAKGEPFEIIAYTFRKAGIKWKDPQGVMRDWKRGRVHDAYESALKLGLEPCMELLEQHQEAMRRAGVKCVPQSDRYSKRKEA